MSKRARPAQTSKKVSKRAAASSFGKIPAQLLGGRKEDSSWFVLRNHLLALSIKDNVNACLLLRSAILLVCCSTMHHVGVDSDNNGLNLLSTTRRSNVFLSAKNSRSWFTLPLHVVSRHQQHLDQGRNTATRLDAHDPAASIDLTYPKLASYQVLGRAGRGSCPSTTNSASVPQTRMKWAKF